GRLRMATADVPITWDTSADRRAERAGFEPAEGFDPFAALAKRGTSAITAECASPLRDDASAGCPARCPANPILARIIDAWPALPEPIRRAVFALVDAASPTLKTSADHAVSRP